MTRGRTTEAANVKAISRATTPTCGLDDLIRATIDSAVTLSERTSRTGALLSHADSHERKPNRMAKASATCCEDEVPKDRPTAFSSTWLNAVVNHDFSWPSTVRNPPAPQGEASKLMATTGPRPRKASRENCRCISPCCSRKKAAIHRRETATCFVQMQFGGAPCESSA